MRQTASLFDHFVCESEQVWWDSEADGVGGLDVDLQHNRCRLLDGQVSREVSLEDTIARRGPLTCRFTEATTVAVANAIKKIVSAALF